MSCSNCANPGTAQSGSVLGKQITFAGHESYFVASRDGTHKNLILYATDIFGSHFLPHQLIADQLAQVGFNVIIPNILNDAVTTEARSSGSFDFMSWLKRNPTENAASILTKVYEEAQKQYGSIYCIGVCYGARPIMDMITAGTKFVGGVFFHPSMLKVEDAPALRTAGTSLLFSLAPNDSAFNGELRETFEKEVASTCTFVDYEGTKHGFSVRPEGEQAAAQSKIAQKYAFEYLTAITKNTASKL